MPHQLELDRRPFFQLFHAAIREDGSDAEQERTQRIINWIQKNRTRIDRVCATDEFALLRSVMVYNSRFGVAPTIEMLDNELRAQEKSKAQLDLITEYEKHADDLLTLTHLDLEAVIAQRIEEYEEQSLIHILQDAKMITTGSIADPDGKTKDAKLAGTKDALAYLMKKINKGVLVESGGQRDAAESVDSLLAKYEGDELEAQAGTLMLRTGVGVIDREMGGLRRGELNGILGYTGQRKTWLVRSIAYNVAAAGKRVLYVPLEISASEELASFLVLHAHQINPKSTITLKKFNNGELHPHEKRELFEYVRHDFKDGIGKNVIIVDPGADRKWNGLRDLILKECSGDQPVDLVIIDYLTLTNDKSGFDSRERMVEIMQEAKQLALNVNGGRGVCFITPIQGSRKGWEEACGQDGAWETTGIYMHSELDKSLDNCFYVFTNDDLTKEARLKIGTCKHRRGANIPATFVEVNVRSGMIGAEREIVREREFTLPYDDNEFFAFMHVK